MLAWELLKHLEEGGKIQFEDAVLTLKDLAGWDYDPIRNPESYEIFKKSKPIVTSFSPKMPKELQEYRIKTWGLDLKDYVWTNHQYIRKKL